METASAKSFNISTGLIGELSHEAQTTRRVLERVPTEKFDYKPHEKSMTMGQLAAHVAEMMSWVTATCAKDQIDFAAGDHVPFKPTTTKEVLEHYDKLVADAIEHLKTTSDEDMRKPWSLKNGEVTLFTMPKVNTIRTFCLNHIWHHRGQLSVYLRLNDIAVPSIYGPSADEGMM